MSTFQRISGVLAWVCLLLPIMPAQGQDHEPFVPYQRLVVVGLDPQQNTFPPFGQLYSWAPGDAQLQPEAGTAYVDAELVLSPDGTKVVFLILPDAYVEALRRGEDPTGVASSIPVEERSAEIIWNYARGIGAFPIDVGMLDLTTTITDPDRFVVVAEQAIPPGAADTTFQTRSLPVWSPDSAQVAWVEFNLDTEAFAGRIMAYDTRTQTLRTIAQRVSLGYHDGGELHIPALVGWGSLIAHAVTNAGVYPDRPDGGFGLSLSLFDLDGIVLDTAISYFADAEEASFEVSVRDVRWVLHRDEWRLAMFYPNLGWVVFDPATGTYEKLQNAPFARAITGEGWKQVLIDAAAYPKRFDWRNAAGESLDTGEFTRTADTFDPEGNPIWANPEGVLVSPGPDGLVPVLPFRPADVSIVAAQWTPVIWQTDGVGTPIEREITP